ncbi:MAG: ATP-binding cassette domain-containing protein [Actinomycetota bacterium]|nr:ATP-binding cassette domain-containing protein [Actinomycetota bacterium]
MKDISKGFPGVQALKNVSFDLKKVKCHGICGENGAGKSTLIKIVSGAYQPDSGSIYFEGKEVLLDPSQAMSLGMQTIYQEHTIFPHLSITENIFVGMEITRNGIMQKVEMRKKTAEVLEYLHSNLNPDQLVNDLSSGEQKVVEIAKALVLDRKVIIMDEPTVHLFRSAKLIICWKL